MKFKCLNCSKECIIPKEELVYIENWPGSCPDCGSVEVHRACEEIVR